MIRRRDVVAGIAALPLVPAGTGWIHTALAEEGVALDGDTIATAKGDIVVHPVDHASLLLGFGDQVFYVDPVGGPARYATLPKPTAVLITHGHGDHFDVATLLAVAGSAPIVTSQEVFDRLPQGLKGNATALANGASTEVNGVGIEAIPAHNTTPERMRYHPVGVGNGYLITLADKVVYVAGDTEPTPEMLALSGIEVAFLPMNLPYTMTVDQAVEAVNTFKPRIVYPYHYSSSDLAAFEAGVAEGTEVRLRNWYPNSGTA